MERVNKRAMEIKDGLASRCMLSVSNEMMITYTREPISASAVVILVIEMRPSLVK